jgi:hypothetical protein
MIYVSESNLVVSKRTAGTAFQKSINSAHSSFVNDIKLLRLINKLLPQAVDTFESSTADNLFKQINNLDENGIKQFQMFMKKPFNDSTKITHDETIKIICSFMDMFMYSNRISMFIREMSLVYLISSFESFLGKVLTAIFSNRPETLRSSKKILTYEEAFEVNTIEELTNKLIDKEVNSIISKDIEEVIEKDLRERFQLGLADHHNDSDWKGLKEAFYRRHIVIHSNCYPDFKYKIKTGYNGKLARLSIEKSYLTHSLATFERCSLTIRDLVLHKFRTKRARRKV